VRIGRRIVRLLPSISREVQERRKEVHKFNYREGVLLMATFAATASMMATLLDTARGLV